MANETIIRIRTTGNWEPREPGVIGTLYAYECSDCRKKNDKVDEPLPLYRLRGSTSAKLPLFCEACKTAREESSDKEKYIEAVPVGDMSAYVPGPELEDDPNLIDTWKLQMSEKLLAKPTKEGKGYDRLYSKVSSRRR